MLSRARPAQSDWVSVSEKVSFEFIQEGYKVIQRYSDHSFRHNNMEWQPKTYCFDGRVASDLGAEDTLKYFGNDRGLVACNVMAYAAQPKSSSLAGALAYDLFISQGMLTHLTTNLNSSEMDELYGNKVRSRMREIMNLVGYDNGKDKRH